MDMGTEEICNIDHFFYHIHNYESDAVKKTKFTTQTLLEIGHQPLLLI